MSVLLQLVECNYLLLLLLLLLFFYNFFFFNFWVYMCFELVAVLIDYGVDFD